MGSIRVLVIDDDRGDFLRIRDLLAGRDGSIYEVDWADNFQEGLGELKNKNHDIYLLDWQLGSESGLDLLREARTEGNLPPVILLSGGDGDNLDPVALELGAYGNLDKSLLSSQSLGRALQYAHSCAQEVNKLRRQAIRDELTGLLNRRGLMQIIQEETARFRRYQRPFTILLMDIDGFKRINDLYGHPLADTVLQEVGGRVLSTIRSVDKVGRYGGDEMLIVLPETPIEFGSLVAKRLHKRIIDEPYNRLGPEGHSISISLTVTIGVAGMPEDATEPESLIRAADEALYRGKQNGKNQVSFPSR